MQPPRTQRHQEHEQTRRDEGASTRAKLSVISLGAPRFNVFAHDAVSANPTRDKSAVDKLNELPHAELAAQPRTVRAGRVFHKAAGFNLRTRNLRSEFGCCADEARAISEWQMQRCSGFLDMNADFNILYCGHFSGGQNVIFRHFPSFLMLHGGILCNMNCHRY